MKKWCLVLLKTKKMQESNMVDNELDINPWNTFDWVKKNRGIRHKKGCLLKKTLGNR